MKNKTKKILIGILIIILTPIFMYLILDGKNLYIDIYNFRQLEKAKPYLEKINENTKKFYNLKEFNEVYDSGIKPIKNCYGVSNDNGNYKYNFGFMLESYIFIYIYGNQDFIYPGYDMPYENICLGGAICEDEPEGIDTPFSQAQCEFNSYCDGNSIIGFKNVISNPCE